MLDGYYSGWLTIDDIKTKNSVGDTRSVSLSAMSATGVGESHRAQTVEFAIADFEHDDLTTHINGCTKAAITLTQVHCLMDAANESNPVNSLNNTENGYMNSTDTNVGGWKSCARRAWCNNVFYNALPDTIRNIVKEVDKLTLAGNESTTIITTSDKVFLLSEIEVFGGTDCSVVGEGSQYTYYKITSNRYKNPKWNSGAVSSYWAERSPLKSDSTQICHVRLNGTSLAHPASEVEGITVSFCL